MEDSGRRERPTESKRATYLSALVKSSWGWQELIFSWVTIDNYPNISLQIDTDVTRALNDICTLLVSDWFTITDTDFSLTELGTSHEVITGFFGVSAMHFTSLWVKLGEVVSMEAVIVLHKTESWGAVWHVMEFFLVHSLGFNVKVEDLVS